MHSGLLLFLDSISGGELILVFIVFLMLFGAKNIPDVARTLGKAMRQFKEATNDIQRDIENSSREIKNQIENETKVLRSGLDIDIMEHNTPTTTAQRMSEEDRLAGSSTPPPAVSPVKPITTTTTFPETPVDIPVTPPEEKPTV